MFRIFICVVFLLSCNRKNVREKDISKSIAVEDTADLNYIAQGFMANADSVVLVSHESYDNSPPDRKTGKLPEGAELITDGKLNIKIIKERTRIEKSDEKILSEILDEKVSDDIAYTHCFDPHHAILLYKDNKLSYLDLCFECYGYMKVNFPFEETMSLRKYAKLKKFFQAHGFTYMLS